MGCEVDYLPEGEGSDLLASAKLGGGAVESGLTDLFSALTDRWTDRTPYKEDALSAVDQAGLAQYSSLGAASVEIITDKDKRSKLADMVGRGGLKRMADKAFTKELSTWIRPNGTTKADGMLAAALGIPPLVSAIAPWIVRTFNTSKTQSKKDAQLVEGSPAIVVLHAPDKKENVLEAGELLERFILECDLLGICYSFFNLPVELDDLRAEIKSLAGIDDEPQLLFRIGYGQSARMPSLRRPVGDMLKA